MGGKYTYLLWSSLPQLENGTGFFLTQTFLADAGSSSDPKNVLDAIFRFMCGSGSCIRWVSSPWRYAHEWNNATDYTGGHANQNKRGMQACHALRTMEWSNSKQNCSVAGIETIRTWGLAGGRPSNGVHHAVLCRAAC